MKKKLFTLLLSILLFFGTFVLSDFNATYAETDESLTTKIAFFEGKEELSNIKDKLNNYKKLKIISDFEIFDKLNALSITANNDTLSSLVPDLLPRAKLLNNIEFKSLPVKISEESKTFPQNLWNLEDINVKELWDRGFTGTGVKIAILDTGIDSEHPALKNKLVDWAEFTPDGSIISGSKPYDSDGHGTHVSGIAAGGSVASPLGIAPDANLAAGLVIPRGGGTFAQILGGLEWVLDPDNDPTTADAPKVVNMSLGAIGYYKIWTNIFQKLLVHNIIPVCAIGNECDGISSSPGNCPNAIGVGAYDKDSNVAYFSSGNDSIFWEEENLSSIYIKPDISAPGVQVYSSVPGGKYEKWSGTSMSSPHTAGAAALLIEAFPHSSSYDIIHFLKKGAIDAGKPGIDSRYGFGKLNLKSSFELLSQSKRVYGKISNYRDGINLYNSDTNLPVYIDGNGNYSTYLLPGSYKFELTYKDRLLKTTIIDIKEKNLNIDISAPKERKVLFEGVVKTEDTNEPLKAKLLIGEEQYETSINGRFSLILDSLENVTIFASGYESKKIDLSNVNEYTNIRLKKASILLVEGISPYITITNPPRLARNYYFEALKSLSKSYTYISADIIFPAFTDLKNYSSVIYFCDSGGISSEEEKEFAKYLDNGGRLLITGRLILTLENYYRQTFISKYFSAGSKESMSFPSVCGFEKSDDFKDFLFSLSGEDGANNQETCDVITVGDSNIIVEPILQYVEYKKEKYAGIKAANGIYKGVLLGFGIEGIGSTSQRISLLREILDWFDSSRRLECILPADSNFRINAIRSDNKQFSILTSGGKFSINNLEPMKYRFVFEGYGYQISQFEIDLHEYEVCFLELNPEKSPFYKVNISLKDIDLESAFANTIYMGKSINLIQFNPKNVLSLSLPLGYFEILIIAKEFAPKLVRAKVDGSDLNFEIAMEKNPKKVLLVDDTKTGDYLIDNYIRVGDAYMKTLSAARIDYDVWVVSKDGIPTFINYLPYEEVLYITGRNFYALTRSEDRDEIAKYLENGGNIAICGNTFHLAIRDTVCLEDYFGVREKMSNIRESTLIGSAGTNFTGLVFDLYDPLVEGSTFITFPTFEPVKDGVTPLFTYLNGGAISTILFSTDKFRSILMPFGIENVYSSDVRQKIIVGLINTLSGKMDKVSSDISYKPKN